MNVRYGTEESLPVFRESRLSMNTDFYTIGHSTHSFGVFLELLGMHGITALTDVRSVPYSEGLPRTRRSIFHGL